jgi:hypothetical protein
LFKNFRIGTACNIEEKGWLTKNDVVLDTALGKVTHGSRNYYYPFISVPLVVDLKLKIKNIDFFLEGGYLINIRRQGGTIKSNIKGTIGTVASVIQPYESPLLDYGWVYGCGVEMNLHNNFKIALLSRYTKSYTGISTWGSGEAYYRHYNYTALLQLSCKIK